MKINFEKVGFLYKNLIKKIYRQAEIMTNNDLDGTIVTVSFVDEKRIRQLNNEYRKVDKPTDVLSFPMLDIVYPQKVQEFIQEEAPDGSLYLGDVVICPKIAKRQARDFGHSKKREIGFLALHGLLHVLGYDHIKEEDEKIMQETAENILKNLNIKRKKNV